MKDQQQTRHLRGCRVQDSWPQSPPPHPKNTPFCMVLALVSGVAHAMLIMTRPVLLQVSGTSNPDEVLTAMRELPESTARDQNHLVPLVAEVVMLSKHGTLNITTSLYGLVTCSKSDVACEPSCHCSFIRCV